MDVDTSNTTANTSMFSFRTFALQVQNIDSSSFKGQTFNVDLGSVEEAMNITGTIEDSALITLEDVMDVLNNATAAIQISEQLLEQCTLGEKTQRLSYSVFLFDTFFRSQDPNLTIGSLIVAARLKCGVNGTLPVPVNVTLRSSDNVIIIIKITVPS